MTNTILHISVLLSALVHCLLCRYKSIYR